MIRSKKPVAFSQWQLVLVALFFATNITYFTLAPEILNIFGLVEPGGILVFPFTFMLSDVITEVYGFNYAKHLVWCVILVLGFFTLFTWVTMQVPTTVVNYGYERVFLNYPRLYLGVSIATLFSFLLNNSIISKLKIAMNGERFWLRSLISTSIGHACFSIIWVMIFHYGEIGSAVLFKLIACMYVWKMSFEIIATPVANLMAMKLKDIEGIDPYDFDTSYNPFKFDAQRQYEQPHLSNNKETT